MITLFSKKHLATLSRFVLKALRDKDKQWLFQNSRGERFDLVSELDSGRIILKNAYTNSKRVQIFRHVAQGRSYRM
jgi:hypothetical protein